MRLIRTMRKLLFLISVLTLFTACSAACSAGTAETETAMAGLDIQAQESIEHATSSPDELLTVHFINVGEGDAILIVQGSYAMLIDGGPVEMGAVVFNYLYGQGVETLEYVTATHPFADHVGGLPYVMRRINVNSVLLPMIYHDTPEYNAFLSAVEDSGADAAVPFAGHTFMLGDAYITVLAPNPADEWENRANYSIVLRVEFGSTSFLLMGDAMREVEANLLNSTAQLSSDVLKAARHGASSATTSSFLDAVSPSIAVISAGENNSFLSHEVLRRLTGAGAHVFRTDLNGNVIITSDRTTLRVAVERQSP